MGAYCRGIQLPIPSPHADKDRQLLWWNPRFPPIVRLDYRLRRHPSLGVVQMSALQAVVTRHLDKDGNEACISIRHGPSDSPLVTANDSMLYLIILDVNPNLFY